METKSELLANCETARDALKRTAIALVIVAVIALAIGWWYRSTANEDYDDPHSQQCMCRSKRIIWWWGTILIGLAIIWFGGAIYTGYNMSNIKTCSK